MKLYFMKQEALDILKSNLNITYNKYFTEKDNKWLWDVCGGNPFVEFKEVDDFQLTPIDGDTTKGEAEFNNCKIVYTNLSFLTESQACDERLWAGLCHSVFYEYFRKRWDYDTKSPKDSKTAVSNIKSRFFFSGGSRSGMYRNSLSKCWWVGHNTYEPEKSNPFEMLDIIGSNDISSKISDIFYSNNFSANPTILKGIVYALKNFKDENVSLNLKDHIRPSLQLLNAVGGNVILDCLDSDEISEILIDNIYSILQGDNQVIKIDKYYMLDDFDDTDDIKDNEDGQKNDIYVAMGNKVKIEDLESHKTKIIKADYMPGEKIIHDFAKELLGKRIGSIIEYNYHRYIIVDIR